MPLRQGTGLSVGLTALGVAMVVAAGGGYYPLYLGVCLVVLTGAPAWGKPVSM